MARTQRRLARVHERAANLRREQAHRLTTFLTRDFGVLGVETLAVTNMLRDRRLARRIQDVGWGEIVRQLAYKTAWSDGSLLVAANRYYPSSKTCHACGGVKAKLSRDETLFACAACGLECHRDLNAALNLAHIAHQQAQAEGLAKCYVARTGRVAPGQPEASRHARGGQVSPGTGVGHGPLRREGSTEPSRRREAPAVVAV